MPRDYYEILGLSKTASPEEITKAYKKLARQHHPDKNPGAKQAEAEARFKEIQTAYDVLNDPKKRANYDQFGTEMPGGFPGAGAGGGQGFPFQFGNAGAGGQQMDPEMAQELYRRLFGGGGGGGPSADDIFSQMGGGRGRRQRKSRPAETVEVDARVPFLTAALGGTIGLRVGDRDIDVKVPVGFEDGKKLRVAGQGEMGEDIYVRVRIEPHPYYRREGKDVLLDVPISVPEAILGGKVEVPTINGKRVEVKVPPGTSGGSRIRLPGLGIAGGDQYLVMKVMVPKGRPDDATKQLIEEYAKLQPQDVRADVPWR
jgi:curved DNA-binding protein